MYFYFITCLIQKQSGDQTLKFICCNFLTMKNLIYFFFLQNIPFLRGHPEKNCAELDNGQMSFNPIFGEATCSNQCLVCESEECLEETENDCSTRRPHACSKKETSDKCVIDGFVGSYVIIENESQRIWNFTLQPGEMTSMHRHDYDYSFVAIKPSRLEVFGEDGQRLFDFWATEASLKINGDFLEPTGDEKLPYKVPRVHAARNIGTGVYHEILFESKYSSEEVARPKQNKNEL